MNSKIHPNVSYKIIYDIEVTRYMNIYIYYKYTYTYTYIYMIYQYKLPLSTSSDRGILA